MAPPGPAGIRRDGTYRRKTSHMVVKKDAKDIFMNTNPTLLFGLAFACAEKSGVEIKPVDRAQAELRVFPNNGAGWFFVRAYAPGRWYWKDEAGANHFNRAKQSEIDAAIKDGAKVQLVGYHEQSLALWATWEKFEAAVK